MLLFSFSLVCTSQAADLVRRETSADFPIALDTLRGGQVQVFLELSQPSYMQKAFSISKTSLDIIKGLASADSTKASERFKNDINLYLLTRTAVLVQKPVTYFSSERVLSADYLTAITPKMKITKHKNRSGYKVDSLTKLAPGAETLEVTPTSYDGLQQLGLMREHSNPFVLPRPELCLIQHIRDFGKIGFVIKPLHGIVAAVCHFAISARETLILTQSISYMDIPEMMRKQNADGSFPRAEKIFSAHAEEAAAVVVQRLNAAP